VNSKIAGVCGGLGEYFGIDPTFVRIIAVLLIFADGVGVLAYIIAWIIMTKRPLSMEEEAPPVTRSSWNSLLPGLILVTIGAVLLLKNFFWWFHFGDFFWPLLLVAIGLLLIFGTGGRKEVSGNPVQNMEEAK
jgi:phage shock protein PspC (stress-responsive transcriptional regulator)